MMRVLHLLSQTQLTGAEVYAKTLIDRQIKDGHNAFMISDQLHVETEAPFLSLPISSSQFFERRKTILVLRDWLVKEKIDVIHCHSRAAVRHAHAARKGLPIAMVTTLHGRQHYSFSKKLFDIYGDYLIAVCENVRDAMITYFGTKPGKMHLIRNPIEMQISSKPKPNDQLRVGIFGRSTGPKGERIEKILLECAEEWLVTHPKLYLEIGVSDLQKISGKALEKASELTLKFKGRFEIHGHRPHLVQRLAEMHMVIASGRIAVEALLQNTQVFAMGEFTSHGIVSLSNIKDVLNSNFGDMGIDSMEGPFNIKTFKKDFREWVDNPFLHQKEMLGLQKRIFEEFSAIIVHERVIETYKAALFKRRINKQIPILMYHKVPDEDLKSRHRIFVKKDLFEKHLKFFQSKKFSTLTFQELKKFWDLKEDPKSFPKNPLLLTFDDGYLDNLTNAQPLLKKYNMKATIFLLSDHTITENTWDSDTGEKPAKLMNLEQKKQLDPDVFEIGSHGYRHVHLPKISAQEVLSEMQTSKKILEKDFQRPVCAFAYPFGSTKLQVAEICREAGYSFAVNTDQGGMEFTDNPFSLFRVNIFPEDDISALRKKTASWYRKYFYWKRKK